MVSSSSPTPFRSVLPHEPIPKETQGFIHIQGAFCPKQKNAAENGSRGGEQQDAAPHHDTVNTSHENGSSFWTKESLQKALLKILSKDQSHCLLGFTLSSSVQQVQVLDPSAPPFTKVRLVYESPRAASLVVSACRQRSVTPAQLFEVYFRQNPEANNLNNHHHHHDLYTFASRPLQWTRITRQPLAEPSWTRSNPPKFRRLLPRPGENMNMLEQERQSTRFVFMTNLLLLNNSTAVQDERGCDSSILNDDDKETPHSSEPDSPNNAFGEDALMTAEAIRSIVNAFDTSSTKTTRNSSSDHDDHDSSADGVEVFLNAKKMAQYCHVGMRSAQDAQRLIQSLQGQQVTWQWTDSSSSSSTLPQQDGNYVRTATSGKLFLDFAAITHRSAKKAQLRAQGRPEEKEVKGEPPRSECTSVTSHVVVPGLQVIEDFVSPEEEEVLMAVLTGPHAPWAPLQSTPTMGGTVKRKVQHYGYVFDYETANVLRNRSTDENAKCPPMPKLTTTIASANETTQQKEPSNATNNTDDNEELEECTERCVREGRGWELLAGIIERTRRHDFADTTSPSPSSSSSSSSLTYPDINQMTVNHYTPGEGIGSHVDTPSAFGDGLLSITLNGGTVMEFRKVDHQERQSSDGSSNERKLVYLPRRSLVLMSGPARYSWEHYICSRMTDTHNGEVLKRSLRVSLTLRTALDLDGSSPMPLVESGIFPPTWGDNSGDRRHESTLSDAETRNCDGDTNSNNNLQLATPACERDHVHAVYDAIATQWHHTRGRRGVLWPGATQFLQRLPPGSIVADVGCGDGKYFPAIWQAGSYVIGTDISRPLLETAIPAPGNAMNDEEEAESRRVSQEYLHLRQHPAVVVADCMNVPLRTSSCDAAICIAVMHHLSTRDRRIQCVRELGRIVRAGGTINIQAWAWEQEEGSRRRFAADDVFVPFNAQPKYLSLDQQDKEFAAASTANGSRSDDTKDVNEKQEASCANNGDQSTAHAYSKAFNNAEYDDRKGLVVFKRYCHMYRAGELEEIVSQVSNVELIESGFESGNHFVILQVIKS